MPSDAALHRWKTEEPPYECRGAAGEAGRRLSGGAVAGGARGGECRGRRGGGSCRGWGWCRGGCHGGCAAGRDRAVSAGCAAGALRECERAGRRLRRGLRPRRRRRPDLPQHRRRRQLRRGRPDPRPGERRRSVLLRPVRTAAADRRDAGRHPAVGRLGRAERGGPADGDRRLAEPGPRGDLVRASAVPDRGQHRRAVGAGVQRRRRRRPGLPLLRRDEPGGAQPVAAGAVLLRRAYVGTRLSDGRTGQRGAAPWHGHRGPTAATT